MNQPDPFEERLKGQPLRPVPEAWRQEILSAARAASVPCPERPAVRGSWLATIRSQLSTLLWPHPKAWAGMAAVWLLILGLNFASREPAQQEVARQVFPPPAQLRELLHEQKQFFTELLGPVEKSPADRPKPAWSQPHSQYYEGILRA